MRPKIVEENIDNFNAVTDDAIARFVKLKEACEPDDHIPDLEGELYRFSTESKFQSPNCMFLCKGSRKMSFSCVL